MAIERFSHDLEMKTREQNRNNKQTEIERFDWFIERIQTRVAFGWLSERSGEKTSCPRTFYKSSDTSLDVILQHDWPIKQRLLHIRVFFGGKTKSPCFDLFIHLLIKQITYPYRNHFSRSYENRSNHDIAVSYITIMALPLPLFTSYTFPIKNISLINTHLLYSD